MTYNNQAHRRALKLLEFLELVHVSETFLISFAEAQGMLRNFYDPPVYFVFIIHHINGSFVGKGFIV